MKKLYLSLVFLFTCVLLSGCEVPIESLIFIDNGKVVELTEDESNKLSFLLQGVFDVENDLPNVENTPLLSDHQKGVFLYNILNSNYIDRYESEGASEGQNYPNLEQYITLKEISYGLDEPGCYHDGVQINGLDYQVLFPRNEIDKIMYDIIGDTIQDCEKINKEGLNRDSNNYIFTKYETYGSDLIGNKGRGTQFTINEMRQISDTGFEISATYVDEALEGNCEILYKLEKNPDSFYGYKVNSYLYSGCTISSDYYSYDFPNQLVYGIDDFIITDQKELARGEIENRSIDLNDDGIQENFTISRDSTNGLKIMGVMGDKGVNFIDDFTGNILDSNNELLPGLSVGMYFGDFDYDGMKEVLVVMGDRKTHVDGVIYKLNKKYPFEIIGHISGKSYIEYVKYDESEAYKGWGLEYVFHAPYSMNGKCNVLNIRGESIYDENKNSQNSSQCYECGDKPVIYLYPEEPRNVSVKLNFKGNLLATYPLYDDSIKGWDVVANPDGTIFDKKGNEYSYLFREGKFAGTDRDFSKGFVVKGEDTIEFLQKTLSKIGLTPREYNEFIVYRYPKMKNNKYNMIYFAQDEYTDRAELTITPTPNSLLRVFMVYKPLNEYVKIPAQEIKSFERKGFTVVEWGGSEVK